VVKQLSSSSSENYQPHQIVCLEKAWKRLYCEIIQVIPQKQRCWVRPLVLVTIINQHRDNEELISYDMRQSVDLVWSLSAFRPALDMEVIPLLQHLSLSEQGDSNPEEAHQKLRQFINQIWQK
jgi:hypothetical protein